MEMAVGIILWPLIFLMIVVPHAAFVVFTILAVPSFIADGAWLGLVSTLIGAAWSVFLLWVMSRPLLDNFRDFIDDLKWAFRKDRR